MTGRLELLADIAYREVFNKTPIATIVCTDQFRIVAANETAQQLFGRELVAEYASDLFPEEYRLRFSETCDEQRIINAPVLTYTQPVLLSTGKQRMRIRQSRTLLDGKETWIIGAEASENDDKSSVASAELHEILDAMPCGISLFDGTGTSVYVNSKALELLPVVPPAGTSATEVAASYKICKPRTNQAFDTNDLPLMRALAGETSSSVEMDIHHENGSVVPLLVCGGPVHDENGQIRHIIVAYVDNTEHHRMQEQLFRAQKMEELGKLTGRVAHDFNNMLTAIISNADLLLLETRKEHPMYNGIEEIRQAGAKAAELTKQLLAFSRKQVLTLEPLSLNSIVESMEPMLRRLVGNSAYVDLQLDPSPYAVIADQKQMEQVLLNLVMNARDAVAAARDAGGNITIRTKFLYLDSTSQHQYAVGSNIKHGWYGGMSVEDNGTGIPEGILHEIFQPFYTTKEAGQGTGLGLDTVVSIVERSNGFVGVNTAVGRGTTMTIYLPGEQRTVEGHLEKQIQEEIRKGQGTILVIEDEIGIRNVITKMLERQNYTVVPFGSAEEALKYEGQVDVVLTDIRLPGMSGISFLQHYRKIHPDAKAIVMTGQLEEEMAKDVAATYLGKPFDHAHLFATVQSVLEG